MTSGSCCGWGCAAGAGAWVTPAWCQRPQWGRTRLGPLCCAACTRCCAHERTRTTSSSYPRERCPCEEWLLGLCAAV